MDYNLFKSDYYQRYFKLLQAEMEKDWLDENVPVQLDMPYPEQLSRWLLFVKWLTAIPLYICLAVYGITAGIVTFFAFWIILFTGRYPLGMFNFVRGYMSWQYKVYAYYPLFMIDKWWPNDNYPPTYRVEFPDKLSRRRLIFLKLPSFLLDVAGGLAQTAFLILLILAIPVWFIILIMGRYPRRLFRVNTTLLQWMARVTTWQQLLRDDYSLFGTTRRVKVAVWIGVVIISISSVSQFAAFFIDDKNDSVDYYNRGLELQTEFNFEKAMVEFDNAIEIDPEFIEAYCARAVCHALLGNYEKGLADASKAMKLAPSNPYPHFARGVVYSESSHNYDLAIADLQRSLDLGLTGMDKMLVRQMIENLKNLSDDIN